MEKEKSNTSDKYLKERSQIFRYWRLFILGTILCFFVIVLKYEADAYKLKKASMNFGESGALNTEIVSLKLIVEKYPFSRSVIYARDKLAELNSPELDDYVIDSTRESKLYDLFPWFDPYIHYLQPILICLLSGLLLIIKAVTRVSQGRTYGGIVFLGLLNLIFLCLQLFYYRGAEFIDSFNLRMIFTSPQNSFIAGYIILTLTILTLFSGGIKKKYL